MNCDSCGRARRADARFCGGCGRAFAPRCPACGRESESDAQFCDGCGASLTPAAAALAETRKVVTIVFADLVGSTALHERLDAESVRRFMARYYQAMRGAVEAHGGTVTQLLGDGVMAVFGAPRVAEDDAIRAVRAAVGMQHAFRALADEQRGAVGKTGLRVAVNTGEIVASDATEIIGDPVNVAARLQDQGGDGDVVIGESTRRLVSELVTLTPLGTFALKGRAETVAAYRVVSLERPAGAAATAFVGREDELGRLTAVYETAVTARRARLVVILGSPGLGKSRLLAELARRLGDGATVLTAHCDATGGATFAPIAEALRTILRLDVGATSDAVRAALDALMTSDDAERGRIAAGIAALLAGTPAPPEETFFVVRRFLAALAAAQPVLLVLDDLQWAEPLLLDLTEHLVQWSTTVPLLILVAARPELREIRSSLAVPGGLVAEVVTLAGLDASAATRLAANVIGAAELPAAVAGRVLATSEGNPLFVGELVRMLVQDGALKREGDRWTIGVELATLEMPPTIHALLAARIERLGPEERTVLERAAVIGRQFSRAALAHLLPRELTNLNARLESLRRSELIESDAGWFLGEPVLRFHHVLIRDAAYRRVLKGTRAELHGRFADWLETRVGETIEHDETIGWHLEQAHQHLRELGPIDDAGRAIGERAARYLAAAGRRALERDDVPLAASLLGRALERLDAADPGRADLALDWCEALLAAGDVGPAAGAIAELGRFIAGSERLRAWHTCFAGQRAALTDPQALHTTADAVAAAADALAALGDGAGEAKAHAVHAYALARLGKVGASEAALDRALAAARRANDRRRANAVLAGAPLAALWGPSPVTRASGRCLDVVRVLRITQGAPAVEAVALRCQAVLEALRGRTEAARRMIASSRHLVEELGITQRLLEADVFAGLIELLEGDAVAAERSLRSAYDGLRQHGLGIDAAQAAALLGRALLAQGRAAEAEALSLESEALAGDDLQAAMAWRGVRAEALARRGEHARAVEFARAAVDLAAATDALLFHADARLALAAALRAAGRSDQAAAEEARAIELWEAKGATLLAERARGGVRRALKADRIPEDRAAPAPAVRRRVRPNAATAYAARLDAAIATRDADAVEALFADDAETVHHPTGLTYARQGALARASSLFKAEEVTFAHEPLATLGETLALCRMSWSSSGVAGGGFDVGAYENEQITLIEVDARGQRRRAEFFADDRLGDAVVRLYERYAETLPDGPTRTRAAATARAIGAFLAFPDLDRFSAALAPNVVFVDHRTVGVGSVHGSDALQRSVRALLDLSEDFATRLDDILALQSDAFLVHWTHFGIDRASGGAFERRVSHVWVSGVDGLLTRGEQFDADRDAEALARFDELIADPAARFTPVPSRAAERRGRRVRPNAATAHAAREDAAFAAHDEDAFATLFADNLENVDHPNGATLDRAEFLTSMRRLLRVQELTRRLEPLATLGDALALCRLSVSAGGIARGNFDVGAYDLEEVVLFEVEKGRCRRAEFFANNRLGDAVALLYERYAELLPDGPARARAAATARSVALWNGPLDLDRLATSIDPFVEVVDHRILGSWSVRGAEEFLQHWRAQFDVAADVDARDQEILALAPDALVVRRTWSGAGADGVGGGAFENLNLDLYTFGADGLQTRIELFDPDRDAEALARFDELTAGPAAGRVAAVTSRAAEERTRRVRPNAAMAHAASLDVAIAARDADALPALFTDESEVVDHTTGITWDRRGILATWRLLLSAADPRHRYETLATLGDSLALCRETMSASGFVGEDLDVGAIQNEQVLLIEVDAQGRQRRTEAFADDRLGDAVARLYERYAELLPAGLARARAAATAQVIAALPGPPEHWLFASDVEAIDHRTVGFGSMRGLEALRESARALLDLVEESAVRVDEVLALRPDACLLRWTHSGTDRHGGAFTRHICELLIFGADGLATRWERFDAERDVEALARFDELTAEAPPARPIVRRLRPNAATANAARVDAAIAAQDVDAFPALWADESVAVGHETRTTWDRQGSLVGWRSILRSRDPKSRHEPLATLGDSLALCRWSTWGSGFAGRSFDVGAYEREEITLVEVDAQGRRRRTEAFAAPRLGDAVARLYERYAELLPDGPARTRAAATAHSVATLTGPVDLDRWAWAGVFAPSIEWADPRTVGLGSVYGVEAVQQGMRALLELTDDWLARFDDVLALRPDALLVRRTDSGTLRASGGAYERQLLVLWIFGTDGRLTRWEQLDGDRDAWALARFDELTAEAPPVRPEWRRVQANAATAVTVKVYDAIAARDADALAALLAEEYELVSHSTGVTYDRQGELASFRVFMTSRDHICRHEPLATLGDSLMLYRLSMSASGFAGRLFDVAIDVGAYEHDTVNVVEVDGAGRRRRMEEFASDRLGDAIVRLYERYAELLPDGPARTRAAATARSVATLLGPLEIDRYAMAINPAIEFVDHRPLGLPSGRGAEEQLRLVRTLLDLSDDTVMRTDDVLALRPDALLVRWTNFGTARIGGGAYERHFLALWLFGPDGLVARNEFFAADRAEEALARFDELAARLPTVTPARRVQPNAATAHTTRLDAAIASRDADVLATLFADDAASEDHPTGTAWDRQGMLATWYSLLRAEDPACRQEPLAILGDSLALCRTVTSARAFAGRTFDVGPYESERIALNEVDPQGRLRRWEGFAANRLGDAVTRLYERYAELLPVGPARVRAAATARAVAAMLGPYDVDCYATAFTPAAEYVDHRTYGVGSLTGVQAVRQWLGSLLEVAEDVANRFDDILELRSDGLLLRWTQSGTDRIGGGAFERHVLWLGIFGADALLTRVELFEGDRDAEALARFDELTAEPPVARRRVRPNAATAQAARLNAAIAARDREALAILLADEMDAVDHINGVTYDRQGQLATWDLLLTLQDLRFRMEPLVSLGESLALCRLRISASGTTEGVSSFDVGAIERDEIDFIEVDERGAFRRTEIFTGEHLGNAVACLYERYAALLPDGPARIHAAATARTVATMMGPFDPDRYATAYAPAIESVDHRTLGTWSAHGREEMLQHHRALLDLADGVAMREDDILDLRPDALLMRRTHLGTSRAGGGSYERPFLWLGGIGNAGLLTRNEIFDIDREDEALARFDALVGERTPARRVRRRVRANAATANMARLDAAITGRDAAALPLLLAADAENIEHTTGATYGRSELLEHYRKLPRTQDLVYRQEPLATLGDSLALCRLSVSGTGAAGRSFDVGAFEYDGIILGEVDTHGRSRRLESFSSDQLGDAVVRLYQCYAELLPDASARKRAAATARSVAAILGPFDPDRYATALASDIAYVDRRALGFPQTVGTEAYLRRLATMLEVATNVATRIDDVLALEPAGFVVRWMTYGIDRAGGGAFEQPVCMLWVFGADGRATLSEILDPDRDDQALARFDALVREAAGGPVTDPSVRPGRRRLRPNAATANGARIDAAIVRRDADALPALFADGAEFVEHLTGGIYGCDGVLHSLRSLLGARDPALRHEPLATLGDALALCGVSWSASGLAGGTFDVGAYEMTRIDVLEVDAQGRQWRRESYAADRLGDAVARLYERYAEVLPDGPERIRAAATARSVAAMTAPLDLDRWAGALAPGIESVDHRTLGTWSAHGAEEMLQHLRALRDLSVDVAVRIDDILDLRPEAKLVRRTVFGRDRASGGAYERPYIVLEVFGSDGLLTHMELFDADRDAEAFARFDALAPSAAPAVQFENAATRSRDRLNEAWAAKDWGRFAAVIAPRFRNIDRRKMIQLEADREQWLAAFRPIFETASARSTAQVVATRGSRLAMVRVLFMFWGDTDSFGPSEIEILEVVEVDDHGDRVVMVIFDPDDLDAAYAELDDRYAAGEAAPYARTWATLQRLRRAFAARDWEEGATVYEPNVVIEDHRPIGWFTMHSPDEYLATVRTLVDLAPDVTTHMEHCLALDNRGVLFVGGWAGSREGGSFEIPAIGVWGFGPDARVQRMDTYSIEQLDAARACYEKLVPIPVDGLATKRSSPRIENAATRRTDCFNHAWEARDWAAVAACFAPGLRVADRRKMVRIEYDRDTQLQSLRLGFEMRSSRFTTELLATRGNRLALMRVRFEGSDGDVGPSEMVFLEVEEVNDDGEHTALVDFDTDDLDAAYAELDARYGDQPVYALLRSLEARDWGRAEALFASDLVVEDHRRLGHETLHGPAAYIESFQALVELAPDVRQRLDHLDVSGRAALAGMTLLGTREGGAFEMVGWVVAETDAQARVRRLDRYDLDQLAEAKARFEAIGASAARDPLAALARPNAATAAMERVYAAIAARDWAAMRAACAADARIEDRRRHVLVSMDTAGWIADERRIAEHVPDGRYGWRLVGTAGDRVELERVLWRGGPPGGISEIECLWLTEVDDRGLVTAAIAFDLDDRRAADREARARWFSRDATAAAVVGPVFERIEASNDHDRTRVRATLADDVVVHDRRRTGIGLIEGADAYVDSLVALWDLAPDIQFYSPCVLALERHGSVAVLTDFGTLREGGAFERLLVGLEIVADGRITRMELFEIEDVDAALARFAELRPDPLRIPPNAATRASVRWHKAVAAEDWESVEALFAPSLVFEDRTRRSLITGDRELLLANDRLIGASRPRVSRTVLATAGDRLALQRVLIAGTDKAFGAAFEGEFLQIVEVDGDGRLVGVVAFETDDRRAASAEMLERFARSNQAPWVPAVCEAFRAINDHDLDRLRATLPGDFVDDDHRRTGVGRLEGADAYVASLPPLFEAAPDFSTETLYWIAMESHGGLEIGRTFGTLAHGGEFESILVRLIVCRGHRFVGVEQFELEHLDVARARFEELRPPDLTHIPPNAASRARDRAGTAFEAGDWQAHRELTSADFRFDDRRKRSLVSGDVELWIKNMEFIRSSPDVRLAREPIATVGDRIALEIMRWTGGPEGGEFENEFLLLTEVDADGQLKASLTFDLDDRPVALDEAEARFVAGEAAAAGGQAPIAASGRAFRQHDWDAARGCLAQDLVMRDHRTPGLLDALDRDQWIASLRAHADLAHDLTSELIRVLAWNRHGRVDAIRVVGTVPEGGPFENVFVRTLVTDRDRIQCYEIFDVGAADQALARFEQLCAARDL